MEISRTIHTIKKFLNSQPSQKVVPDNPLNEYTQWTYIYLIEKLQGNKTQYIECQTNLRVNSGQEK